MCTSSPHPIPCLFIFYDISLLMAEKHRNEIGRIQLKADKLNFEYHKPMFKLL